MVREVVVGVELVVRAMGVVFEDDILAEIIERVVVEDRGCSEEI